MDVGAGITLAEPGGGSGLQPRAGALSTRSERAEGTTGRPGATRAGAEGKWEQAEGRGRGRA